MKDNLKESLKVLKEKEDARREEIAKLNNSVDRINQREKYQIQNFENGMKEDRNSGLYMDITDGKFEKMLNDEKVKIKQNFENERNSVNEELKQKEEQNIKDRTEDYNKISPAINEYYMNMVNERGKAKSELDKIKAEQKMKIQEIEDKISEKDAERTRIIMQNRNSLNNQFAPFMQEANELESDIQELKAQKETINDEYKTKIDNQNKYIDNCKEQIEQSAKFLQLTNITGDTIYDMYNSLYAKEIVNDKKIENENIIEEETIQVGEADKEEQINTSEQDKEDINEDVDNKVNEDELRKKKMQELSQMLKNEKERIEKAQQVQSQATQQAVQQTVPKTTENDKDNNEKFSITLTVKGYQIAGDDKAKVYDEDAYRYNSEYEDEDIKKERIDKIDKSLEGKLEEEDIEFLKEYGDLTIVKIMSQQDKASEILKEYIETIKNPDKESNISIKYDLKKTSLFNSLASFFKSKKQLDLDQISEFKNTAKSARNYADVVAGPIIKLQFKISDMIKNAKQKRLNAKNITEKETTKEQVNNESGAFRDMTEEEKNIANEIETELQNSAEKTFRNSMDPKNFSQVDNTVSTQTTESATQNKAEKDEELVQ